MVVCQPSNITADNASAFHRKPILTLVPVLDQSGYVRTR